MGNFLGSDALAAVGSSGHIIFLLVGLFGGLFTGASVVISGYFGAQEHRADAHRHPHHRGLRPAGGRGAVRRGRGRFPPPCFGGSERRTASSPIRSLYFRIYFSGVVFVTLYNTATGILQAVGDSRHPLYYLIISSITNVVLDLLFVAVFHMGVDGAALATVISQAVSATLGFIRLIRSEQPFTG